MNPVDLEFARRLPKIELHAHLSGSISRECLHEVWLQKKQAVPDLALEDPLSAIPPGKVDYDLQTFFPLFSSYIYKLCSDIPSIDYTTKSVLDTFQADNVVYLEVRTTPRAIPAEGITKEIYVDTVLKCLQAHNADPKNNMHASLILSVDRSNTLEQAMEVVELSIARQSDGVVGVDLCGNPARGPVHIFEPAFARARAAGLMITLHFAEAPVSSTDDELWTLLSWQPNRIGHVIHVKEAMKEEIVKRGIGVELCLSCNVHAKMITGSFENHHFGWWKGSGIGVALCTDDVGVFCSPLSEEYYLAAKHFCMNRANVRSLCERTIGMIFGTVEEKEPLMALYANWDGWRSGCLSV